MIRHFIIMSSSYIQGYRIALHFYKDEDMNAKLIGDIIKKIEKGCGDNKSISTHSIETDSGEWESVVKKDEFFKNVKIIDDVDSFVKIIKDNKQLTGLDVAKYILTKVSCTHLKLQKLVYYCFADYLCKYNKKLFYDEIYAFEYGPVIKSVRNQYKGERDIEAGDSVKIERC